MKKYIYKLINVFALLLLLNAFVPMALSEEGKECIDCITADNIKGTPVPLTLSYSAHIRGGYVANGTCLRNYGYGTIDINEAHGTTLKAFLYWVILNETETSDMRMGVFEGQSITGTLIANTGDPCWMFSDTGAWVYRADVTSLIKPGIKGAYSLSGFTSGVTDGTNPWALSTEPLVEGASMVIVYEDTGAPLKNVAIYDGAVTFSGQSYQTIISGFNAGSNPSAKTTYIVADGQLMGWNGPNNAVWNGIIVGNDVLRGLDVVDSTGSRDTTDGWLWDTYTTPVNVSPGATSAVAEVDSADSDCLTWVAQVFQVNAVEPVGGEIMPSTYTIHASVLLLGLISLMAFISIRKKTFRQ
jgi:hypothetical protein